MLEKQDLSVSASQKSLVDTTQVSISACTGRKKQVGWTRPVFGVSPNVSPSNSPSHIENYLFIARTILAEQILMGGRLEKTAAG